MKKKINPLIAGRSVYRPTSLGKLIMELAKNETDEVWEDFFAKFLNAGFYMPAVATTQIKNGRATAKSELNAHMGKNLEANKPALMLFERSSRAQDWAKKDPGLTPELNKLSYTVKFAAGYDFLHAFPPKFLKEVDVMIDFGKTNSLILDSEKILWLRKNAKKIK